MVSPHPGARGRSFFGRPPSPTFSGPSSLAPEARGSYARSAYTVPGKTGEKGGEHYAVRGVAEDQTGYILPRGWRSPVAVAIPRGSERLGRILAGDGITQSGGDHGGRQHGTVRGDKDGLGGPLRHRSVPSRYGRAGDGDAPSVDVRAASVGGRIVPGLECLADTGPFYCRYSPRIREGFFLGTELPIYGLLGNSGHEKSRDC